VKGAIIGDVKFPEDDAPPPWIIEMTADRRAKIAKHIKSVLRG